MRRSVTSRCTRVLIAMVLALPVIPGQTVAAFSCTDVHIVWSYGANQYPNDFDFQNFVQRDLEPRIGAPVTHSDYQLGDAGYNGHRYQRADSLTLVLEGTGASVAYLASVSTGVDELTAYLTDRAAACPNDGYILGWY